METRKIYYENCMEKSFEAKVLSCEKQEKGYAVVLDQTAFYPEGGGQACDLGTLDGVAVLDVREVGDNIVHLCEKPLEEGKTVEGGIDWARRFDLMQQHAGEHIVSGIINQMLGHQNVGFHVGDHTVTIDFDGPITQEELQAIEQKANEAVWANLQIRCWYPGREELPQVKYRSKRELPWPVRIVQIPGYDSCACCGVHVQYTGQIGIIKLFSCVKFHQGVRIEMACGGRALGILNQVYEQNRQVSQAFSAKVLETGEAARKMNEALAAEKFHGAGLQKQLFAQIAQSHKDQGDVVYFAHDLLPAQVRDLSDAIADTCGGTAAVFSGSDEAGYTVCLVNKKEDIKELGKALADNLNGRGGGKSGYFQGSVKATKEEICNFFA